MRVLSSWMRTAILRNVQEPVSPHVKEQAELIGLPAVAGGAVGARVELHVLDEILHAPACAIDLFVEDFCPAWQVGDDEAYVAALLARLDAGDDLAGLAPAGCGIAGLEEAPHLLRF